jgi:response regulator RpfG family c-di-GMP phosphodiesterase
MMAHKEASQRVFMQTILEYFELQRKNKQPLPIIMDATRKILLIDDDTFLRVAVAQLIRRWSYEVTVAESLQTAKESFLSGQPFSVVVSDFNYLTATVWNCTNGCVKRKRARCLFCWCRAAIPHPRTGTMYTLPNPSGRMSCERD